MLGDDLTRALPELQAQAESMMLDQIVVESRGDTEAFDPDTNESAYQWSQVWSGKGRTKAAGRDSLDALVSEQQLQIQAYECSAPVTCVDLKPDMRWRVISSPHPGLAGKTLTITSVHYSTYMTARRCLAIDNQG